MTGFIKFSVAALLLTAPSSVVLAQSGEVVSNERRTMIGLGAGTAGRAMTFSNLTPEAEARIARRIDDAAGLMLQGGFADARGILRNVITEQDRAGAYPAVALRNLAAAEFALFRPVVAAGVLIQLADAAAAAGDPATELQALVDAAILFGQEGRSISTRALLPRIRKLLNSPAIPDAMRLELAGHLNPE